MDFAEIPVDDLYHFFRRSRFHQCGEVSQVGKDKGDLFYLPIQGNAAV